MKYFVYIHTCPNGKKYVGTTTQKPERRWLNGRGYYYNEHFYKAILKYGWDNITHEVFEVNSEREMYEQEVNLVKLFQSNNPEYGYNNSIGGDFSTRGLKRPRTAEVRKARSLLQKQKWQDPEYRKKISEAHKGKSHRKGKQHTEEARRKMSETRKGKSHPIQKYFWAMPDGTVKLMSNSNAARHYLNKGISIQKVNYDNSFVN